MSNLSALLAAAKSTSIEYLGAPLHGLFEVAPAPPAFGVKLKPGTSDRVQGIAIKVVGGSLRINNTEAELVHLWCDTAPSEISASVTSYKGKQPSLKLWNIWRDKVGGVDVTHAWLGNAGMRAEQAENGTGIILRCSDGVGPVDFDNLQVTITYA